MLIFITKGPDTIISLIKVTLFFLMLFASTGILNKRKQLL